MAPRYTYSAAPSLANEGQALANLQNALEAYYSGFGIGIPQMSQMGLLAAALAEAIGPGQALGSPLVLGSAPRVVTITGVNNPIQLGIVDTMAIVSVQTSGATLKLPTAAMGVVPGTTVIVEMVGTTSTAVLNVVPGLSGDLIEGLTAATSGVVCMARPHEQRVFYCTTVVAGAVNWEVGVSSDAVETYTCAGVPNLTGTVTVPIIFMGKQSATGSLMAGIRTITSFRFGVTPPVTAGTLTATLQFNGANTNVPALVASTTNPNGLEIIGATHNASNNAAGSWPAQNNPPANGALYTVQVVGAAATGPTNFVASFSTF